MLQYLYEKKQFENSCTTAERPERYTTQADKNRYKIFYNISKVKR
jgi:hypothetical protein